MAAAVDGKGKGKSELYCEAAPFPQPEYIKVPLIRGGDKFKKIIEFIRAIVTLSFMTPPFWGVMMPLH